MKKTSVYLTEHEAAMLKRLAEETGKSQARVLREALAAYDAEHEDQEDRDFRVIGSGRGDGRSIADIPEEEYLRGFGEDDIAPYRLKTARDR